MSGGYFERNVTGWGRPEPTYAFVQWKGTDVCLDFQCECGYGGHFDGYFAYVFECPGCGDWWEAPTWLSYRRVDRDSIESASIRATDSGWGEDPVPVEEKQG